MQCRFQGTKYSHLCPLLPTGGSRTQWVLAQGNREFVQNSQFCSQEWLFSTIWRFRSYKIQTQTQRCKHQNYANSLKSRGLKDIKYGMPFKIFHPKFIHNKISTKMLKNCLSNIFCQQHVSSFISVWWRIRMVYFI